MLRCTGDLPSRISISSGKGNWMNEPNTVFKEEISQGFAKGHCPICSLVAEFQERLIAGTQPAEILTLCNYHAWMIAKGAPADRAAKVFLDLLERSKNSKASGNDEACTFCEQLRAHELVRLEEMREEFKRPRIQEWMKLHVSFCLKHASQLDHLLTPPMRQLLLETSVRSHNELKQELNILLEHLRRGDRTGWGVLGRAAEFLTSRRGMRRGG